MAKYHAAIPRTYAKQCWQIHRHNVAHAWRGLAAQGIGRGSTSVPICVIDTGLDYKSNLPLVVWPDALADPTNITDNGNNSYSVAWATPTFNPDTCFDLGIDPADPVWTYSHGTNVWSIIKGDTVGIPGIAPDARGYFIGLSASGTSLAHLGLLAAVADGAKIITTSVLIGGQAIADAIAYAQSQGCLVFSGAGNDNQLWSAPNAGSWSPSNVPGVIVVSGAGGPSPHTYDNPLNAPGQSPDGGTNALGPGYGPGVELVGGCGPDALVIGIKARPGGTSLMPGGIPPTDPSYEYGGWGAYVAQVQYTNPVATHRVSTSYSTPAVAAIAALAWSANPSLTGAKIRSILNATASKGRHTDFSTRFPNAGIPDAGKAVAWVRSTLVANTNVAIPFVGFSGSSVSYDVDVSGNVSTILNGTETYIDLSGFYNDGLATTCELWLVDPISGREQCLYTGAPTSFKATTKYTPGSAKKIKVVAKSGLSTVTETYDDILVTTIVPSVTTYNARARDTNADKSYQIIRNNVLGGWRQLELEGIFTRGTKSIKTAIIDGGLVPVSYSDVGGLDWGITEAYITDNGDGTYSYPVDGGFNLNWYDATPTQQKGLQHHQICHNMIWSIDNNGISQPGVASDLYGMAVSSALGPLLYLSILALGQAGAQIISMSFGGKVYPSSPDIMDSTAFRDAVDHVIHTHGCLMFNAAGNDNQLWSGVNIGEGGVPGTYPDVVTVSGTGGPAHEYDDPWNRTSANAIAGNPGPGYGPGIEILSGCGHNMSTKNAFDQDGYEGDASFATPNLTYGTSTSWCTPVVAGIAGLIWSVNPALTWQDVRRILVQGSVPGHHADWMTRYPGGLSITYGKPTGIVNAGKSVAMARATLASNAGVPIPYVGFSGQHAVTAIDSTTGEAKTTLNGTSVFVDVAGFCDQAITSVELWLGNTCIYNGAPKLLSMTATYTGTAVPLKVVAKTAGATSEVTYTDVLVTTLVENSGGVATNPFTQAFGFNPQGSSGASGQLVLPIVHPYAADALFDDKKSLWVPRSSRMGLTYIAGPWSDIPLLGSSSAGQLAFGMTQQFSSDVQKTGVAAIDDQHLFWFGSDAAYGANYDVNEVLSSIFGFTPEGAWGPSRTGSFSFSNVFGFSSSARFVQLTLLNFRGMDVKIVRSTIWPTSVTTTVKQYETRIQRAARPRYRYTLTYNFLGVSTGEADLFLGFLHTALGSGKKFSIEDPVDGTSRVVRYENDSLTMEQVVPGVWKCATLTLITVK